MKLSNIKSKFIVTIITIALVVVMLFFSGCSTSNNSIKASNDVFITVSSDRIYDVVYDKETNVMYVRSYMGVFKMLVNADGTPKLYKGK